MEKINWKYTSFTTVVVTLVTLFMVFSITEAKAKPAVIDLIEIHAEIEDIEDNMQAIIENWDTGSRKDPLKDLTKEVDKLSSTRYKFGILINGK